MANDSGYNPKTGEYFPAMYVFDPFTGEKLVWAEGGRPAPPAEGRKPATTATQQPAQAAPAEPKPTAQAGEADLRLVVNTPIYGVFFLSDVKLTVVLRGPERYERTVKNANPETAYTFVFEGIPAGEYKVTARYGNRTTADRIHVARGASKFAIDFD